VTFYLRQVALSESAAWLGSSALPSDVRTAELHFADRARAAWNLLPDADQRLVEAYTRGVNRALSTRRVRLAEGFVLLDVAPERWEPWHSLAVERLVLYLQADPMSPADSLLQQHVGWYGGSWNVAWGGRDGATMGRFLMGHTSLPFLQEVLLDWPDTSVTALTVPGTLMIPAARHETASDARSWTYLLQPDVAPATDSTSARADVDWVRLHTGRRDTVIAVHSPELRWPGFTAATDTDSWLDLWRGADVPRAWQLMRPDGLSWRRSRGAWKVEGAPATRIQSDDVVMVAAQPPEQSPADVIDRFSPVELSASLYSGAANARLQEYLEALPDSSVLPQRTRQAVTYLANWNTRFEANEIGATLYDAMTAHMDSSLAGGTEQRLTRAVSDVEHALGPDMSLWRWSESRTGQLRIPGWLHPTDTMPRPLRIFMEHYPLVGIRTGGHPTTMVWRQAVGAPAPNAWEGLFRADGSMTYRSRRVPYQQFLAEHAVINEIHDLRRRN